MDWPAHWPVSPVSSVRPVEQTEVRLRMVPEILGLAGTETVVAAGR